MKEIKELDRFLPKCISAEQENDEFFKSSHYTFSDTERIFFKIVLPFLFWPLLLNSLFSVVRTYFEFYTRIMHIFNYVKVLK